MLGYGCHETWETDIRAEIGNDVLRVYRVGLKNTEQGKRACIALCGYDKHPLGRVNRNLLQGLWKNAINPSATSESIPKLLISDILVNPIPSTPKEPKKYGPTKIPATK